MALAPAEAGRLGLHTGALVGAVLGEGARVERKVEPHGCEEHCKAFPRAGDSTPANLSIRSVLSSTGYTAFDFAEGR
jgi:hypothetical protein